MKHTFAYFVIVLLTSLVLFVSNESEAGDDDVVTAYALLDGGVGEGLCTVKQDHKEVWAKVTTVGGFTAYSSGTTWIQFDGVTVGRLDGTFSDGDGYTVFEGHFAVDKGTAEIAFDVRDHDRDINTIVDNGDLTTELTQPGNALDGTSIGIGTCTFVNSPDNGSNQQRDQNRHRAQLDGF